MTELAAMVRQLREQAVQARRAGHYAKAAQTERQLAELAATHGLEQQRVRALLWEGHCLRQLGDHELALAVLMQAANTRSPDADPADVFSALTNLIHLAIARKPVAFSRKLLNQGEVYLLQLGKPEWRHLLDFLAGELAAACAELDSAWQHYQTAWAGWRESYPYFTAASHLWALCKTAFRRRDAVALAQWTAALEERAVNHALEKTLAQRARLLLFRAQRAEGGEFAPAAELALTTLATLGNLDMREPGTVRECLRVLALAQRWTEIDQTLERQPLGTEFEDFLCLGDGALNRARAVLNLAPVDDEYETELPPLHSWQSSPVGLEYLDRAETHYRAAETSAASEDTRLEIGWHGATLAERLGRVRALRAVI